MPEDFDLNVKNIVHPDGFSQQDKQKPKHKQNAQGRMDSEDEAKDHFDAIAKSAERAHLLLEEKKSPYRFCVYRDNNEIFIDLVVLDNKGLVKNTIKRNITHREFSEILKNIEKLDGLVLDCIV